ncbi:MAG: sigma-70 family RNA polymerase sigma factor [Candidatus Eremiobacteraeota bacterium]|nr:sigma-70 family RNA polymerase sigma factor [Candidatus Eremiobacteraeota bacterium]
MALRWGNGKLGEDDDGLAMAFAARRPMAFDEAYRRYADVCFSVALNVLRSPEDAQDCVHDAFLRVWRRRDSFSADRGSLRAFLIACVRNEALSRRRSAARHRTIEAREAMYQPTVAPEVQIPDFVEHARLRRALDEVPAEQRRALELAYFGGMTHSEVAAMLGEPLGTVKSRIALGLRRLGKELRPQEGAVS